MLVQYCIVIVSIIPMSAVVTKTLLNTVTVILINNNDIVFLLIVFNYREVLIKNLMANCKS